MADSASDAAPTLPVWQSARRDAIIDAADRLLRDRPLEQVQMSDVAAASGVARGTLYRYFASKELLYAWVVRAWEAPLNTLSVDAPDDIADRLRRSVRLFTAVCRRDANHFAAQRALRSSSDPAVRSVMTTFADVGFRWVAAQLRERMPPERADTVTHLFWTLFGALLEDLVAERRVESEVVLLMDAFLDALRPQLGPR